MLRECVGVSRDDRIAIFFDNGAVDIADALCEGALAIGCIPLPIFSSYTMMQIDQVTSLPTPLTSLIRESSAIFTCLPDGDKFANYRALVVGCGLESGCKCVHMPGVRMDLFDEAVRKTDYGSVRSESDRVANYLKQADNVVIKTTMQRKSHELALNISGRDIHLCNGNARSGTIINLPTGEAYVAPIEYVANGHLALVGSTDHRVYKASDRIILCFENGVLNVDKSTFGTSDNAHGLREYLATLDEPSRTLCEFGIGTNLGYTKLTGSEVRDEKVAGTIHIAIGKNKLFGGTVQADIHRDIIIHSAVVTLDSVNFALPGDTA